MEKQPIPEELSDVVQPLLRFRSTALRADTYTKLLITTDNYLEREIGRFGLVAPIDTLISTGQFLEEEFYDYDAREAVEHTLLLPLRFVAPNMEVVLSFEQLTLWYMKATEVAVGHGRETKHSSHCLEDRDGSVRCEHNVGCPLRATRQLLLQDAFLSKDTEIPSSSALDAQYDADWTRKVVGMKVRAAIVHNLTSVEDAGEYLRMYDVLRTRA